MSLSRGLTIELVARSGEPVKFSSPDAGSSASMLPFYTNPDGAAVFPMDDGGFTYVSNSETGAENGGGVYGVEFDSRGRAKDYKALLTGTTRNCVSWTCPTVA